MKRTALVLLMLALLGLPAIAGTDYNLCFSKIDMDYDGEMTKAEFSDAFPEGSDSVFLAADTDKNGTVSHEEWEEYKESQGFEEGEHGG